MVRHMKENSENNQKETQELLLKSYENHSLHYIINLRRTYLDGIDEFSPYFITNLIPNIVPIAPNIHINGLYTNNTQSGSVALSFASSTATSAIVSTAPLMLPFVVFCVTSMMTDTAYIAVMIPRISDIRITIFVILRSRLYNCAPQVFIIFYMRATRLK